MSGNSEGTFYVVCIPNSLKFYQETASRQSLKIYNTYDFPIKFRVLCTSPQKYIVVVPEGLIRPGHNADIAIQLKDTSPENFNKTDLFRIEFQRYEKLTKGVRPDSVFREVSATYYPGKPNKTPAIAEQNFEQTSAGETNIETTTTEYRIFGENEKARKDFIMSMAIAVALMSTIGLMFPLVGDKDSFVPNIFHLSPQFKQVLAFASGLSLGFILRQQF